MTDLLSVLGLVLALEGALYAAFPGAMKRALAIVSVQPEGQIRVGGLIALALGVLLVWLIRGAA